MDGRVNQIVALRAKELSNRIANPELSRCVRNRHPLCRADAGIVGRVGHMCERHRTVDPL